jgi:hypothetical protein
MADYSQPNDPNLDSADDHLSRLLCAEIEDPWYHTFIRNVKEFFNPPKLPPLQVTSKPVPVKDIWGLYGRKKKSFMMSTGVQLGAVALVLLLTTNKTVQTVVTKTVLYAVDLAPPEVKMKPQKQTSQGGGGGGDRSPLPASYGKLPKFALKQFTPPVAVYNNMNPKLAMEPTLIGDPNTQVANVDYPLYGDPLSKYMTPSNGQGSGGGTATARAAASVTAMAAATAPVPAAASAAACSAWAAAFRRRCCSPRPSLSIPKKLARLSTKAQSCCMCRSILPAMPRISRS